MQCVSDSNPFDDEPDPIEEAQEWLKMNRSQDRQSDDPEVQWAGDVIEGLLDVLREETGLE